MMNLTNRILIVSRQNGNKTTRIISHSIWQLNDLKYSTVDTKNIVLPRHVGSTRMVIRVELHVLPTLWPAIRCGGD